MSKRLRCYRVEYEDGAVAEVKHYLADGERFWRQDQTSERWHPVSDEDAGVQVEREEQESRIRKQRVREAQ